MGENDAFAKLRTLSKSEFNVLKLYCQSYRYTEIAKELLITNSTVKNYMGRIYVKLGLDQLPERARTFALARVYCPAIQAFEQHGKVDKELVPMGKEEEPQAIKRELMKIVEEDDGGPTEVFEGEIIETIPIEQPRDRETPRPKPNPFMFGFMIIALISILFTGISIYNRFFGPTPIPSSIPPEQPVAQAVGPADNQSDPTITFQPSPTMTELPLAAATLPPKPAILFEDNFDQGLSEAWEVVSGNPMVVNGMLSSDQDSWIIVGDPTWENYSVEFTAEPDINAANLGFNVIGVRVVDMDNMYAYKLSRYETLWSIVKSGKWNAISESADHLRSEFPRDVIRITVNKNSITLYINSTQRFSFVDSKYPQGRVLLKVCPGTTIDNFKVKEILE